MAKSAATELHAGVSPDMSTDPMEVDPPDSISPSMSPSSGAFHAPSAPPAQKGGGADVIKDEKTTAHIQKDTDTIDKQTKSILGNLGNLATKIKRDLGTDTLVLQRRHKKAGPLIFFKQLRPSTVSREAAALQPTTAW